MAKTLSGMLTNKISTTRVYTGMALQRFKLKMRLTEILLGTAPLDPLVYAKYIESLKLEHQKRYANLPADELQEKEWEAIVSLEKGVTGFRREEEEGENKGKFFVYNYQFHGLLKETASTLNGGQVGRLKLPNNFNSKMTNQVRVLPRKVYLPFEDADLVDTPCGRRPKVFERPLRGITAKGPRTALTRSEYMPAGRSIECEILLSGAASASMAVKEDHLRAVLDHASVFSAFGQWRNGDYGKFEYELTEISE
jgi:hypothetical protein